jgi:hypothetical protein
VLRVRLALLQVAAARPPAARPLAAPGRHGRPAGPPVDQRQPRAGVRAAGAVAAQVQDVSSGPVAPPRRAVHEQDARAAGPRDRTAIRAADAHRPVAVRSAPPAKPDTHTRAAPHARPAPVQRVAVATVYPAPGVGLRLSSRARKRAIAK